MISNGDDKFRMVNIGVYTVDLKQMRMHLTTDPANQNEYISVLRSNNHFRPRPGGQQRFSNSITAPKNRGGLNASFNDRNWLGDKWSQATK